MSGSFIALVVRALSRYVGNPVVRALLRTPASALVDAHLLLVRYRGRRTGRQVELPVAYVRDGGRLLIVVGGADRKTWWRNFATPLTVELVVRRDHQLAVAQLIPADSQGAIDAAAAVRAANPRARISDRSRIVELRPTAQRPSTLAITNRSVDAWPHEDLDPRPSELPPTAFRRHEAVACRELGSIIRLGISRAEPTWPLPGQLGRMALSRVHVPDYDWYITRGRSSNLVRLDPES